MRVILCPVGSHGDVHPFVALGRGLTARGHRVTFVTTEAFEHLAVASGFEPVVVGSAAEFEAVLRHPDLWHPTRSVDVIFGSDVGGRVARAGYAAIRDRYVPGETVVVAGILALGARLAHETLGVPLATVHLQPGVLVSVENPPVFATLRMGWWPRWARRFMYWFGDRYVLDRKLGPPVNTFRRELGLPPIRHIYAGWMNSPQRVIGLFPAWYGSAPDWPPQFRQTGFLRYDQADAGELPPAVRDFLAAGEPPVVFSFGSAMRVGGPYFRAAAEACRLGGFRGLLLAKGGDQIPVELPPGVAHFDYAPFSLVFPWARAVVHHGGIGTSAQALAAGVPQVVMPLAFDQPDNADRLLRLGVARVVYPRRFTPPAVAAALAELSTDPRTAAACRECAAKLAADDPLPETCRLVEELAGTDRPA